MEAKAYEETFTMPPADGGGSPLPGLLALLEEMMELAGRHAEKLGVGVRDLHAKGLTWVLARLHARIASVPAAGAGVTIATWPCGRHRLFAVREFRLHDAAGAEILRATSAWALMNLKTRRPARLDPHLPAYESHPGRMVEDEFAPLPSPHPRSARSLYRAEPGDIDINDHVNNTVYLGWGLRSAPEASHAWAPLELEAAFLGEARLGDEVACLTEIGRTAALDAGRGDAVLLQSVRQAAADRELTRLRTRWQTARTLKKSQ